MNVRIGGAELQLVEGDIADQDTDAIVTAAHWDLHGGQGTDGSVHFRAGPRLLDECRQIGGCPIGGAVITRGYDLAARHVIHAVGPVWERGKLNEAALLASAYEESLSLAVAQGLRSISFPSISTGAFNYPMRLAAPVAMSAIVEFLRRPHPLELVRMVLYPRESKGAYAIYAEALRDVSARFAKLALWPDGFRPPGTEAAALSEAFAAAIAARLKPARKKSKAKKR